MPINSRAKGARAERAWRDELRNAGFTAHRGQQFSGGGDSPDVICEEMASLFHCEVKFVERLNIRQAMDQAEADASLSAQIPYVAHKTSPTVAGDGAGSRLSRHGAQFPGGPFHPPNQ
jgi:Holliday junction resolvase